MIALDDIRKARRTIKPLVHRTPLIHSTAIGAMAGVDLYLKCENLQKTGSFKPRGQINRIANLTDAERARGIIIVSAGNAAQGCAYAARSVGARCVVVMPETAPQAKVDATRGYGAEVVQHGTIATLASMFDKAEELQREHGYTFSHAFDDPYVTAGQASIGVEILEDLADVDVVFVSIGGGGLISGVALGLKLLSPRIKLVGVESSAGPAMQASLQAGHVVRIPRGPSIADGMGAPFVGELPLQICKEYVDEFVTVTDDEITSALKLILQRTKMLVEGAGAAPVAALLSGRANVPSGSRVACVLSGGNIDLTRMGALLATP
jgi:threonine dehydratase